jgi:uncharacterized protein with beta-barrel porin domain
VTPAFATFGSTPFTELGATPAVNSARVEAGFNWTIAPGVIAYGSYVGNIGENLDGAGAQAGVKLAW